jgi:hypothetical protein
MPLADDDNNNDRSFFKDDDEREGNEVGVADPERTTLAHTHTRSTSFFRFTCFLRGSSVRPPGELDARG